MMKEAIRWLNQGRNDLEAAKWNAEGKFFAQACFLSQQAAEKALKAYLSTLENERLSHIPHIHLQENACKKIIRLIRYYLFVLNLINTIYLPVIPMDSQIVRLLKSISNKMHRLV